MAADPVTETPPTPGQQGADSIRGQKQGWSCSFGGLTFHDPLLPAWPCLLRWFTTPQSVPPVGDQSIRTHESVENITYEPLHCFFSFLLSPILHVPHVFLWTRKPSFFSAFGTEMNEPIILHSASHQEEKGPLLASDSCQAWWIAIGIDDQWQSWLLQEEVTYHYDYGLGDEGTTRFFSFRIPWLSLFHPFLSDGHREEPQGPLPRRPGHRAVSTKIHDCIAMAMWLE